MTMPYLDCSQVILEVWCCTTPTIILQVSWTRAQLDEFAVFQKRHKFRGGVPPLQLCSNACWVDVNGVYLYSAHYGAPCRNSVQ